MQCLWPLFRPISFMFPSCSACAASLHVYILITSLLPPSYFPFVGNLSSALLNKVYCFVIQQNNFTHVALSLNIENRIQMVVSKYSRGVCIGNISHVLLFHHSCNTSHLTFMFCSFLFICSRLLPSPLVFYFHNYSSPSSLSNVH